MTEREPIRLARRLLQEAIDQRVFPAAVAEVGDGDAVLWHEAFGTLTFQPGARPTGSQSIFDLASLTKPIATTTVLMQLVADQALSLSDPLASFFPEWTGLDRQETIVQDLLEHASGLAARLVDAPPHSRREFEHEICAMPLECARRARAIYSDLGFILLGFLAEDRAGISLDRQVATIVARLWTALGLHEEPGTLAFRVPDERRSDAAPTEPMDHDPRRGRALVAEVHDDYAARLGGVAGHAGLFGTAHAVGAFARGMLRGARGDTTLPAPFTAALVARATTKSAVPGSSRALGWDTMLPTSSCGTEMSPAAFGHVGFTGTSLWIDPILDRYFVLLTNRAAGDGTSEQLQYVRRGFHDALARF